MHSCFDMKKRVRKKLNSESGQSTVEFALILPLLLLILCGILDFGWIYANQYKTQYAAYSAARYASLHVASESSSDLTMQTRQRALDNLIGNANGASVDLEIGDSSLEVTVEDPVKTLTFVAETIFGEYYTASSSCVSSF